MPGVVQHPQTCKTVEMRQTNDTLQVYESLKRSGELSEEQMSYFDREDGAELLYEMRLLSVAARPTTAVYIADQQLSPQVNSASGPSRLEQYFLQTPILVTRSGKRSAGAPANCASSTTWRAAKGACRSFQ